jgi:2,4-dienoyl-CoA reductase (NADPH2)
VKVKVSHRATAAELAAGGFDHVALATGILPRTPDIPGIDHPKVARYIDMIEGRREAGRKVAIIGAGGIGFDVAELLSHGGDSPIRHRRTSATSGASTRPTPCAAA